MKTLLAIWLCLLGMLHGKSVYTAELTLGDFFVRSSEASDCLPPAPLERTRAAARFGYDGPPGDTYCHNDPVNKVDKLGLEAINLQIRTEILEDLQRLVDSIELMYGPSIGPDAKLIGAQKHVALKQSLHTIRHSEFIVGEQSINQAGGAIKPNRWIAADGSEITRWPTGSKRPDLMILMDSDDKLNVLNGKGFDIAGKVDAVLDLKTGLTGISEDWTIAVSNRLSLARMKIQELRAGGNIVKVFNRRAMGVGKGIVRGVDPLTLFELTQLPAALKLMAIESANDDPFVGRVSDGNVLFSVGKTTRVGNVLWWEEPDSHFIKFWNGPFVGKVPITKERFDVLEKSLETTGRTLQDWMLPEDWGKLQEQRRASLRAYEAYQRLGLGSSYSSIQ